MSEKSTYDTWYEDVLKDLMDSWYECFEDLGGDYSFEKHMLNTAEHSDNGQQVMAARLWLAKKQLDAQQTKIAALEGALKLVGMGK